MLPELGEIPVLGCNPNREQGDAILQVYMPLVIQEERSFGSMMMNDDYNVNGGLFTCTA